jgi:hypothetical protein
LPIKASRRWPRSTRDSAHARANNAFTAPGAVGDISPTTVRRSRAGAGDDSPAGIDIDADARRGTVMLVVAQHAFQLAPFD